MSTLSPQLGEASSGSADTSQESSPMTPSSSTPMSTSSSPGSQLRRSNSMKRRSHPWSKRLLEEEEPKREVSHERELINSSKLSASLDNLNLFGLGTESNSATEPVSSSGSLSSDFGDVQPTRMRSFSGPLHVQVARSSGSGSPSPATPSSATGGSATGSSGSSGSGGSGSGTPPICSSPVPLSARKQCFSPALQISVQCSGSSPVAQLSPLAVAHASASPSSLCSSTSFASSASNGPGARKRRSGAALDHAGLILPAMLFGTAGGSGDEATSGGEDAPPPRKRLSLSGVRLGPSSSSCGCPATWAAISSTTDAEAAPRRQLVFPRRRLSTAMEEQVSSSDDIARPPDAGEL